MSLSWHTDDAKSISVTAFKLTQAVAAATATRGPCTTRFERDPTQIACPAKDAAGLPTSSGTVTVTVQSPVACADSFGHRVSEDGQIFIDQQPIVSGNSCSPPPLPPPPPPPESNDLPAGGPVSVPLLPLAVGADSGGGPLVKAFDVSDLSLIHQFLVHGRAPESAHTAAEARRRRDPPGALPSRHARGLPRQGRAAASSGAAGPRGAEAGRPRQRPVPGPCGEARASRRPHLEGRQARAAGAPQAQGHGAPDHARRRRERQ